MSRSLFTTFLLFTLLTTITLISAAPVPIPGRLAIATIGRSTSKEAPRSSPLSAAARTLSKNLNVVKKSSNKSKSKRIVIPPNPDSNADAIPNEGMVDLIRGWVKREVEQVEDMVERAEHQIEDLVSGAKRSATGTRRSGPKFAPRSKDPSERKPKSSRLVKKRSSSSTLDNHTIALAKKRATPADGVPASALGKCFYVGSDFKMHDCNEQVNVKDASLNSAKSEEELKVFSSASAALAAATAGGSGSA